jgi:uroporphyrinogen III methyltransferase/synthase
MTVYLVGAGPGDPGLLTVRGRDLLAQADVVLYDALVDPRLLALAPPTAQRINVGKVPHDAHHPPHSGYLSPAGQPSHRSPSSHGAPTQAQINALLVHYGRLAPCVVRLKGGDPFLFGRGGEEALALAQAGIPCEVVPGVSAALAVPAAAGIPVTHRGLAASLAIVTGHEAPDKGPGAAHVDWGRLATATDTLVILMGLGRLPQLVATLLAQGRAPTTPAAVIGQGTTPWQQVVVGLLAQLPGLVVAARVRSPATIVVGEVVRLRGQLAGTAPAWGEAGAAWREAAPRAAPVPPVPVPSDGGA